LISLKNALKLQNILHMHNIFYTERVRGEYETVKQPAQTVVRGVREKGRAEM